MRVAIYLGGADEDRDAFDLQREQGWSNAVPAGDAVVSVYEVDGKSGLDDSRPAFLALLADAQAGAFDAIIVDQRT
jgi:DNA invertase Pin-like site-specific DNA recombinase